MANDKKKTLLYLAKTAPVTTRSSKYAIDDEQIELALAHLEGTVTMPQINHALKAAYGVQNGSNTNRLYRALEVAYKTGKIKIVMN